MRGYLWQDLAAEVAEEFERLSRFGGPTEHEERKALTRGEFEWRHEANREAERLRAVCVSALPGRTGPARGALLYKHLIARGRKEAAAARGAHRPRKRPPERTCSKGGCLEKADEGTKLWVGKEIKLCARHAAMARAATQRHKERKRGMREYLTQERQGITHRFRLSYAVGEEIETIGGYITASCYPDGRVGEVFVKVGKPGDASALLDQWAIAFSVALQYGAPFETLCQKFVGARFEPSGATSNKEIPRCTSLVDYAARWLLKRFGKPVIEGVDEYSAASAPKDEPPP